MHTFQESDRWLALNLQGDIGPYTLYVSKRGKLVCFPRAPPPEPPTPIQENYRQYFRNAANAWIALVPTGRTAWATLAQRANLGITGYNLWTWFYKTRNEQSLACYETRTGITVPRP